jgi:hypothetical protein
MKTRHIVPGDSPGGSLMKAVRDAGRDDEVLPFLDDLSCGPIDADDLAVARATWWSRWYDTSTTEDRIKAFWNTATATEAHLVVWFGRHAAFDLSFLLAWADRMGERPYDVVDVTGQRLPFRKRDGSLALTQPAQGVGPIPTDALSSLLGKERAITPDEVAELRSQWQRLRQENAPFRIVTADGLVSAPVDFFDSMLLGQVTEEWLRAVAVIADTVGYNDEPYRQVGEVMLLTRVVALVEQGKLLADGDPWDMFTYRIRLPA